MQLRPGLSPVSIPAGMVAEVEQAAKTTGGNSCMSPLMEIFSFFSYFPESAPGCTLSITP